MNIDSKAALLDYMDGLPDPDGRKVTRTTVRLNEDLLREAKKVAAESGTTLTALIADSLRKSLAERSQPRKRKAVRLPVFRPARPGTWPGVNLDSNAALLARMDGLDAPD